MKFATSLLLATATVAVNLESQASAGQGKTIWEVMTTMGYDMSSEGSVKPENVESVIKRAQIPPFCDSKFHCPNYDPMSIISLVNTFLTAEDRELYWKHHISRVP